MNFSDEPKCTKVNEICSLIEKINNKSDDQFKEIKAKK